MKVTREFLDMLERVGLEVHDGPATRFVVVKRTPIDARFTWSVWDRRPALVSIETDYRAARKKAAGLNKASMDTFAAGFQEDKMKFYAALRSGWPMR